VCKAPKCGRVRVVQVTVNRSRAAARDRYPCASPRGCRLMPPNGADCEGEAAMLGWFTRAGCRIMKSSRPFRHDGRRRYGDLTCPEASLLPGYPWQTRTYGRVALNRLAASPIAAGEVPLAEEQNGQSPTRLPPTSRRARTNIADRTHWLRR
jgi:hypothetical protein